MNVRRLKILSKALRDYAAEPGNFEFDMGIWADVADEEDGKLVEDACKTLTASRKGELPCGTAGCAIGLAASIEAFQEEGLTLSSGFDSSWAPGFGKHRGWAAVEAFFGLDARQAEWFFSQFSYGARNRGPLDVADRIDEFLLGEEGA